MRSDNFNSYKILDQDESLLRANGNPFSVVVLTTLLAIVNKNISDEALKDIKHDLYEEMMKRKMDKKTRQGLYDFLAYYVSFQNPENFYIFEREVENKLGRSNIMGTQEYLLDKAEKKGIAAGIEKGRLEERAKIIAEKQRIAEEKYALELKLQTILEEAHEQACQSARMMLELGVDKEKIAKATGLTIEEVEKL